MIDAAPALSVSQHPGTSAALRPSLLPSQDRASREKAGAQPSSALNGAALTEQASAGTEPTVILYVDKQRLARDCISAQLATQLPEWTIEPLASVCELREHEDWSRASLVIFNTHGDSLRNADVAGEMAMIAKATAGSALVVMSELDDATEVLLAAQLGARGYLPAGLPFRQVMAAIRFINEGGTYIPVCVLAASSELQRTSPAQPMDERGKPIEFSPRQIQVVERLQQGKQNKIIAYELGMCESTVKVHIRHIMKKLNARNRTQVVLLTNKTHCGSAVALAEHAA
jgi:DNA-binding NarL/FixJ family response regulator